MIKAIPIIAALLFATAAFSYISDASGKDLEKGLYAKFKTSKGDFTCKLYEEESPLLVDNFVGLANGTGEHMDFSDKTWVKTKFYDGLTFHRVIPKFMIQGGCPFGTGGGNPGYRLRDEFHPDLKHDKPGVLSMANGGPNSNGSQFFITVVPTPWLDNKHSIIGQVVEGMDVVNEIVNVPCNERNKPKEPVIINTIEIEQVN